MNLCQAAALALVGWYLMVPPPLSNAPRDGRIAALSRWTIARAFDAEKDCRAESIKRSRSDPTLGKYRGLPPEEIYDAQCIATDDPRLKSN